MVSNTKIIQAILDKLSLVDKKVTKGFSELKEKIVENGERIDKLGLQLAELEDDAPTKEEHEELEGRLEELERQATLS